MGHYGQGPILGKLISWIFVVTLAAVSIHIASLVGAGAGIGVFLACTVGGVLVWGWIVAKYGTEPAATPECCQG